MINIKKAYFVSADGKIVRTKIKSIEKARNFPQLKLIFGYDSRLFKQTEPRLDRYSVLQLISLTSESISAMHEVASVDPDSDFITNVGKALGSTIGAIADGSSTVIKAIGTALHDGLDGAADLDKAVVGSIANASAVILDSAGQAGSSILGSAFGGAWGLARTIVIILLVLAFFYLAIKLNAIPKLEKCIRKRTDKHDTENRETTETIEMTERPQPPLPPKQNETITNETTINNDEHTNEPPHYSTVNRPENSVLLYPKLQTWLDREGTTRVLNSEKQ